MGIVGRFIYLAALASCVSSPAQALTLIYSDLGSGDTVYQTGGGWEITGTDSSCTVPGMGNCGQFEPAFSFSPGTTSYFTELQVGLGYVSGTNSVTVYLMSDSNGSPGAVLESWNDSGLPSYLTCCTLQTLFGNGTIPLVSGEKYWVAVQPGSSVDTYALWQYNPIRASGTGYFNEGTAWKSNGTVFVGAFDVQGSLLPTPEPGTVLTLAVGMIALFAKLKKRK